MATKMNPASDKGSDKPQASGRVAGRQAPQAVPDTFADVADHYESSLRARHPASTYVVIRPPRTSPRQEYNGVGTMQNEPCDERRLVAVPHGDDDLLGRHRRLDVIFAFQAFPQFPVGSRCRGSDPEATQARISFGRQFRAWGDWIARVRRASLPRLEVTGRRIPPGASDQSWRTVSRLISSQFRRQDRIVLAAQGQIRDVGFGDEKNLPGRPGRCLPAPNQVGLEARSVQAHMGLVGREADETFLVEKIEQTVQKFAQRGASLGVLRLAPKRPDQTIARFRHVGVSRR